MASLLQYVHGSSFEEGMHSRGSEGVQCVQVTRHECVRVILHGQSELEASNVVLIGSHTFEVTLSIFRLQNFS